MTRADELSTFAVQLARQTGTSRTPPADWGDAFFRLNGAIHDGERTVVLLDEISWLAYDDDTFAGELKRAWDNLFKKHSHLILVLCGSVSSWIRENIVDNSAYMGRRSLDLVVRELSLRECVQFWGRATARVPSREIFDVLSVTGGVPRYLEEIDPGASANENIRRLAFLPKSILRMDFDEMFSDVITKRPQFTGDVLRALSDGTKGAAEIADCLGVPKSGNITSALVRLEEAGFVALESGLNPETGRESKERRYRLRDNYSRFYLKYIDPVKKIIDAGSYCFTSMEQFDGWDAVMGLAFENLIVNNYRELLKPLHLERALIVSAAPFRRESGNAMARKGVQVDLVLQTKLAVCLVEIKRRKQLGREVISEMEEKCKRITRPDGVSLKTALVYDGELVPSVEADGYFDAVIDARTLLGL